jgi:hypothetical protein
MDKVYSLTLNVGREVRELVEAAFDLAPVVGVPPIGDEALHVFDPNARPQPSGAAPALLAVLSKSPMPAATFVTGENIRVDGWVHAGR